MPVPTIVNEPDCRLQTEEVEWPHQFGHRRSLCPPTAAHQGGNGGVFSIGGDRLTCVGSLTGGGIGRGFYALLGFFSIRGDRPALLGSATGGGIGGGIDALLGLGPRAGDLPSKQPHGRTTQPIRPTRGTHPEAAKPGDEKAPVHLADEFPKVDFRPRPKLGRN